MLIQKGTREDAIHALINIWLKDPRFYCGWCGKEYLEGNGACCEQPFIARNSQVLEQFYQELLIDRENNKNDYASNDAKDFRVVLRMPPGLLRFLELTFESMYGEKLFTDKHDINWFAKKFYKYFAMPRRV